MEEERKPLLMYYADKAPHNLTFCNISDPTKSYSTKIPDDWSKTWLNLCTVQHGWFLWENKLSNYVSSFFLWNPLNLKKIMLPPLNHYCFSFGNYILLSPPTTSDEICSVFVFSSHSLSVFYYQLGDKEWTEVSSYDDIAVALHMKAEGCAPSEGKFTSFKDPVYCNGRLYAGMWTSLGLTLVVFKKDQHNGFSIAISCTSDIMTRLTARNMYIGGFEQTISKLIGFDNVLFRIDILHALDRVVAVFVHKYDFFREVWEKVESIKDTVFFISYHGSAFACQAINPEIEGGCVYIALKNCNFVYVYNIEDKILTTSQHSSNVSKSLTRSLWFMPETRMTGPLKGEIGKAHQVNSCWIQPRWSQV